MIRLRQIKVNINNDNLKEVISKKLNINSFDISNIKIVKKSIDSRKKPNIYYVYEVDISVDKKIAISIPKVSYQLKSLNINITFIIKAINIIFIIGSLNDSTTKLKMFFLFFASSIFSPYFLLLFSTSLSFNPTFIFFPL